MSSLLKEWILEETAEAVAVGYDEFADLNKNNYPLSFDEFLYEKGHTAIYLHYAHARICSIIKKSGKDIDELNKTGKLALDLVEERALGIHLLQFTETVEEACTTLLPHLLCDYLCKLSKLFTSFYSNCQVMRKCFYLLGITPLYKL